MGFTISIELCSWKSNERPFIYCVNGVDPLRPGKDNCNVENIILNCILLLISLHIHDYAFLRVSFTIKHHWVSLGLGTIVLTWTNEGLKYITSGGAEPLRWRHNGSESISNHQPHDCLLNCLFKRKSKKTSKLRATGLYAGKSLGTGEFPAQMASNVENASIWWRHHALIGHYKLAALWLWTGTMLDINKGHWL